MGHPQGRDQSGDEPKKPAGASQKQTRPKPSLLSLEPRLMFDAAAAATAAEVRTEQVAQEQAEAAVSNHETADHQTQESSDSHDLLQALSTFMPNESRTEVVFVDPTVPNYRELLSGMDPNIEVIVLDGGQDGVEQMASALSGRVGIDAIHLISHGDAGTLQLGTGTLTAESMSGQYADKLATIQQALSEQADILVYGCDFAAGDEGRAAVNQLAALTGADVQASSDQTGHISLGGDWEFEVRSGSIETSMAINHDTQINWAGILGTQTVSDTFSAESYSNNDGTQSWSTSWSETDAGGGGASGGDVRVNSSQLRIDTDTVGNAISRGVDLSNASSATLTFNYTNTLLGADRIDIRVSTDGGTNYQTLSGGIFSSASNTGSGTASFDLSSHMSANTRIQFIVTATGGGERLYVDNVQISYNINSAPTDLTLSANIVAENAANGTVVGTVSGTDVDAGDTKTYSLTDTAGGRFAINSSTGEITVANSSLLNYEAATSHNVTVRVTDSGGLTYDETFTINVTNVNETPVAADDRAGLHFDGVDDFVQVGSAVAFEVTDTVTMEAWINREPSSNSRQLIINKEGEYEVGLDADGSLMWAFANTNPGWVWHDTGVVIPLHTWTHVAVSYDHGTVTTFVDGVVVETYAGSGTIGDAHATKDDLRIGGRENNPANQYFAGQISEVQVWNVARTAGDIASDLGGTLTGTETGLLGYWKFNENTGTNADNLTANSDGTLGGGSAGQTPQWSTYRVSEDNTLTVAGPGILGNDYDPDGDALSAVMVTGPSHASSFTLNSDGSFSYTPTSDFFGTDSFTYRVSDGTTLSNIATVYIQVNPVNDAPTDLALSASQVAENASNGTVVGTVSGTDVDAGDTKTYALTDTAGGRFAINSSTGQITVANGGLLNYENATSHNVTVRVTDSGGLTYDETFTINLTNVNEAPAGADTTVTINEDTPHSLTTANFGFSDVDAGDSLSAVRIDGLPGAGTLQLSGANVTMGQVITVADITAGNLVFTPAADAHGIGYTSFTFSVRDSNGVYDAAPNTLTVNVTAVNDAPVITPIAPDVTFVEGGMPQLIDALGTVVDADSTDFNGGALTVSISQNGTADDRLMIGNFGIGPGQVGSSGSDVTYGGVVVATFTGGTGAADPLVVTFNANATPAAVEEVYRCVQFGNVSDNPSTATRQVTYGLTDGDGGTATAKTKLVYVQATNDAPTDLSLSGNTVVENATNGTVVGTVSATDPDAGDTKAYSFIDNASGRFAINSSTGEITVANGSLLNYESATSHNVTVRVTDSGGLTYDETFTINLTNVNEAPTAADATVTIAEDTSHTLTTANFGFSDVDAGDSLSAVRIDSLPGVGTLTLSGVNVTAGQVITTADITAGNLVFTPVADANGTGYTSFTFSVRDSSNVYDAAPNTLTVNVTAVNDTPIAGHDSYSVQEDGTLTVDVSSGLLANDMEIDGDVSTVTLVTGPSHGTLTLNADGSFVYTPSADFSGTDTFTYKVNDGTVDSNVATVTLTVASVNDGPTVTTNVGSSVAEGGTDTVTASELAVSDVDNPASQLIYSIGTAPVHGRLELTTMLGVSATAFTQADIAANRVVYVHDGSESTSDHFTFTVSDGAGGFIGSTTVTLTITPVNDSPTITSGGGGVNASYHVAENVSAVTIVTGVDVDLPAQALTYDISGGSDHALFTIDAATGALHFTAPRDFEVATDANGDNVYVVQVRVTDNQGASTTQTIQVTVTNVAEGSSTVPQTPFLPPSLVPTANGGQTPASTSPPAAPTAPFGPQTGDLSIASADQAPRPSETVLVPTDTPSRVSTVTTARAISGRPDDGQRTADPLNDELESRWDLPPLPPFTIGPVEAASTLDLEPPDPPPSVSELLMAKLDDMTLSLEEAIGVDQEEHRIVARVTAVTGFVLSAGFVAWALRSSALLASCLATMPAWKHFDPLPVVKLTRKERDRQRQDAEADRRQEEAEFGGLQHLLGQNPPLKP